MPSAIKFNVNAFSIVTPPLVFIISPWEFGVKRNRRYLRECVKYCFDQGYAPVAAHGFYPQYLDDHDPHSRTVGITCGHQLLKAASFGIVFADKGVTSGMHSDIEAAARFHKKLEWVYLRTKRGERGGKDSKHG